MAEILNSQIVVVIRAGIDIFAVAYLIYFLYTLFQDTNSITIMKGLLFIVGFSIVANIIGLSTLVWIFQYVVNYVIILLVVLFQPEIRRILSRVGRSGLGAIRENITPETVMELARAAFIMSEEMTGAIIIMERNVGLRDLVEESVALDAGVKAEILQSIFSKMSNLHDGAVIIENGRISAARVMIPSVKVGALPWAKRRLGTRHRAGIAITLDNDAISIIISEETGKVSIAHDGVLDYDLNNEKFIRRLNEVISDTE